MRFIDPKTDFAFKRIFGSDDSTAALISFINAALQLEGERLVDTVEIRPPNKARRTPREKESIVDIACTDKSGVRYLVEMQVQKVKGFANRMFYTEGAGCSRTPSPQWGVPPQDVAARKAGAYSEQLGSGDTYPQLSDVVIISVMDFTLLEDTELWHSIFLMKEKRTNYAPFEQFLLCCVELTKFNKTEKELSGMMDKWAYFLKEVDGLEMRPEALGEPEFDVPFEKAEMAKLTRDEKTNYEVSLQKIRDDHGKIEEGEDRGMKKGRKEGMEKGMEKGMKKGMEKGRKERDKEIALQMLAEGESITKICKYTGLTKKQVNSLK